jgi:hypothetical protein
MKVAKKYSHFSGEEYLIIHHKDLYNEILDTINKVDCNPTEAEKIFTKLFKSQKWNRRKSVEIKNDFIKNKIALAFYLSKNSVMTFDLFASHLLRYFFEEINVGIEVLPTKKMQSQMSSGVAYYEGEVYNVLRHGRGNPPVPLLVLGIEP